MSKISLLDAIIESDFKSNNTTVLQEEQANMSVALDKKGCKCLIYKFDRELGRAYKGGLFPFFAKKKACVAFAIISFLLKKTIPCML